MEELGNIPILISTKPSKEEFKHLERLPLTLNNFTIGRGLHNAVVIPFISISRNHCTIKCTQDRKWVLEDYSTMGVEINGQKLGKGTSKVLDHGDIISLEPNGEFIYEFQTYSNEYEIPKKRIKLETNSPTKDEVLKNVKIKFEESQNYEIKLIEDKIKNAQNRQMTSLYLKQQLQTDMKRQIKQLKSEFAVQIENLKGEKNEVEQQKALLIKERDSQLADIQNKMQEKINDLLNQIQIHNKTESMLMKENNSLKEKLKKEREVFLSELDKETISKKDMLHKLELKIKDLEETRLREKKELEETLKKETEELKLAKEKEVKKVIELKCQREIELREELNKMRQNLENQLELMEQEKLSVEEKLNKQLDRMKQYNDKENAKIEQLMKEREEIQKTLVESQANAQKSLEKLQQRVADRETELAALAADRIQKQAEQSGEVIHNLQEQLEKVKKQLQDVEKEKDSLLENLSTSEPAGEGTSKQSTLNQVGELMESELQCSICSELFVEATNLACSHTFCKYCITMWKKKKKDCPICRAPITSECRSLVLDTFIEKMVQNLTDEMKVKRQELLNYRAECESELVRNNAASRRRGVSLDSSSEYTSAEDEEEGEEDSEDEIYVNSEYLRWGFSSGSDDERLFEPDDSDSSTFSGALRSAAIGAASAAPSGRGASNRRARGHVAGRPGAIYAGYGRCYNCGARGHWAPGCPFR